VILTNFQRLKRKKANIFFHGKQRKLLQMVGQISNISSHQIPAVSLEKIN